MDDSRTVTVYNFRLFDTSSKGPVLATFKAPRALIVERFGGQVLEGTEEEVDASVLDAQGRYRRIATGWGELG